MKQQIKDLIQRVDALEHELAFLFYPPFQLFPSDSISPFPLRTSILKMSLISFFYNSGNYNQFLRMTLKF